MATYNVPCVIAITGNLPNGGGTIASGNYTITPDLTALPTGFMTADTAGHDRHALSQAVRQLAIARATLQTRNASHR